MQNLPTARLKPRITFFVERWNRAGIAALISAVEDLLEEDLVKVISLRDLEDLEPAADSGIIDLFCFSSMTTTFALTAQMHRRLRSKITTKNLCGEFLTICGGAHPSGDPQSVLESGFDLCCVGEGEEVMRELVTAIIKGEDITEVGGIFARTDGQIKGKLRTVPTEIERYSALPSKHRFPTYIEIGRGCRWGCRYCQTPRIHGSKERFRSPISIEKTITLYRKYGMKDFRFLIPNALGYFSEREKQPNCDAIAELLERSTKAAQGGKIYLGSFPSEIRPDYVTSGVLEILKRYVSNRVLVIGSQSGDDRILRGIGRGHLSQETEDAVSIAIACGFKPIVDIILGLPGEDEQSRLTTFGLMEKLGKKGTIFNVHFFMPIPGTPFQLEKPVFLTEKDRRVLGRFAQIGIVRGRWRSQEEIARKWESDRGWRQGLGASQCQ